MNQEKIGDFIAELRKENNMTQIELANKLGVTDRAVSKWENGRGLPDVSLFEPLCKEFNISVNELLKGEKIKETDAEHLSAETIITINYICLFNYLFISSQMSAKPYFIGSTGILLLW